MHPSFTTYSDFRRRYPIQFGDDSLWLGSGTYGKVIKVEDQVETEWVAIKICECRQDDAKSLKAEVELAKKVPRHANIARYDACHRLQTEMGLSDFAIMKYYKDGNLATLLKSRVLGDGELRELVRGILEGLKVLHRQRIVHRDFKPANILISRDYSGRLVPKIADFGLSKFVAEDAIDSSDFDLSDGRGTPAYKAPEQITGGTVSFNLDLWAFGVILYEMVTGEKPFSAAGQSNEPSQRRETENKIAAVQLPERLSTVAEPYQSMIRRCLVKDIRARVRKPEELLTLLDQPTTLDGSSTGPLVTPPVQALAEADTDVFKPTSPTSPPADYQAKPEVVSPAGQPLTVIRTWLWFAIGAFFVGGGFLLWSNRTEATDVASEDPRISTVIDSLEADPTIENNLAGFPQPPQLKPTDKPIPKDVPPTLTKPEPTLVKKGLEDPPKSTGNADEAEKAKEELAELKKEQSQQAYDELIDKGNGVIKSANNKGAAMGYFKRANQLATTHGLKTDKGNESYTLYLKKADRIYAGGSSYLGAMEWYQVAQAINPTNEVENKIRECKISLNLTQTNK